MPDSWHNSGTAVDRPQSVIDSSALYQLTQFARRQAGLPPLVGNDLVVGGTAAIAGTSAPAGVRRSPPYPAAP